MGTIYAGSSGWAYSTWKPKFYPAGLSSAKFLEYYASRLNSVEVNYSFRAPLTRDLLRAWIAATPAGFRFAVKAHYSITHVRRLRGAKRAVSKFLSSLRPLQRAGKLGPVLFQLPPFLKCDLKLLECFLKGLPHSYHFTFEFRHPSWFCNEVYGLLRMHKAALCLAESDKLETPHVQTADFSYLRLRKSKYPPMARSELWQRVEKLRMHGHVFAYFKHEAKPDSVLYAEQLLAALRE